MRVLLSLLCSLSILPFIYAVSIELTSKNSPSLLRSGTWLVEHFSPSCRHCIDFAPTWDKITNDLEYLQEESDFHFGSIDCLIQGDLCFDHDVRHYPTIQLWKDGERVEEYEESREYDLLVNYIHSKATVTEKRKPMNETVEYKVEEYKGINPEGRSVELNGDSMKEIASGDEPWFIKFYAPWCGHCQRLAPTWVQMASHLQNQLNVGEINCDNLPDVCSKYGVRGYPTLRIYGNGKPIEYDGKRDLKSLSSFAKSHSGPLIPTINMEGLDTLLNVHNVVVVYLHEEKEAIPDTIDKVARNFISSIPFYSSQDEQIVKKYNHGSSTLPILLLLKDNTAYIYPSHEFDSESSESDALIEWIESERFPLVSKLGPTNDRAILEGDHTVILHIVNNEDSDSISAFRNVAIGWLKLNEHKMKTVFAEMDAVRWGDYVSEKFNMNYHGRSKVIIYDAPTYKYYDTMNDNPLSIDHPESIYWTLEHLSELDGQSILTSSENIGRVVIDVFGFIGQHLILFCVLLGLLGFYAYRYITYHNPKILNQSLLPSFRPVDTHKD
ncbi:thioredoxin-like protein [Pilobolus umbonatus]|nr:thioredoxin-like protein [Pilobolus umbonatus]